ncbi:diguanylate cyclase [Maribrevibacterium harenarium]|uniref:Diguanylate cyclase n=1 Tax=Maribrevibacterium harenarium TaxID=2589817 RepID=A0A501WI37_9GAMM|nr:DEAD/DEAH box helicase family protein [Maribrevibacterium harenarium]TPE49028.1 diguanylate cyclase [Maribrevibacterium harenarium]
MLRDWQRGCVTSAIDHFNYHKHFFCLATPGAGKTVMAATVGKMLLEAGKIDYIVCLSPSRTICESVRATFKKLLGRPFSGRIGSVGVSLTYQSLLGGNHSVLADLVNSRVFVVLDEIHHCSGSEFVQGNAWGIELLRQISSLATFTLSLSGTPWRTDGDPITFASYDGSGLGLSYQWKYGLSDAVTDKVCRLPKVIALDAVKITKHAYGPPKSYSSIAEFLKDNDNSYLVLLSNESLTFEVLKRGVERLTKLRKISPTAGGLVVAASYSHARFIKQMLEDYFSQKVVLVSYKDDDSIRQIEEFRQGTDQWIVSIAMVSEGVDIPRLQVCCHLSATKTELYFRQVLGRIIRVTKDQTDECFFYTLAEENLISYAKRLEQEVSGSYIKENLTEEKVVANPVEGMPGKSKEPHDISVYLEDGSEFKTNGSSSADEDLVGLPSALVSSALSIDGIRERVIRVLMNSQPAL